MISLEIPIYVGPWSIHWSERTKSYQVYAQAKGSDWKDKFGRPLLKTASALIQGPNLNIAWQDCVDKLYEECVKLIAEQELHDPEAFRPLQKQPASSSELDELMRLL